MARDKIKRFFECLLPVSACNFKCTYCYAIQQQRHEGYFPVFTHSPEYIAKALSYKRLGGPCLISITGIGETLLCIELVPIIKEILKEKHYINITTNGTVTKRFVEICEFPKELLERVHISFSLHYIELKNKNLLDQFYKNVNMVRNAGCSVLVQFNLYDEYLPYLEDIKSTSIKNVGALPQVALTRDQSSNFFKIWSDNSFEEYIKTGEEFNSPLFECTCNNFNVKRKEFCYAGDWSYTMNLETGDISQCYSGAFLQNLYENIKEPLKICAVGNNCKDTFCVNSSHFMGLGIIPEINMKSYGTLRNRPEAKWQNPRMQAFLNSKLKESNKEYSMIEKLIVNYRNENDLVDQKVPVTLKNVIKSKIKKMIGK